MATKGRTKLGMALEQSAKEILAHVKGEARLPARRVVLPNEVDVKWRHSDHEGPTNKDALIERDGPEIS